MTCKEVNEFLADYLDGKLPWRQWLSFKVHLLLCRRCRQYLASYKTTVRMAKSLGQPGDDQAPEELVQAILAARRTKNVTNHEGHQPEPER